MDILHGIEAKALALRDEFANIARIGEVMSIAEPAVDLELPMERPLFTPALKPLIADIALRAGDEDLDAASLYNQVVVDTAQLAHHIRNALQARSQITLAELTEAHPLEHGLAELVAYLQLASASFNTVVDETTPDVITWEATVDDGAMVHKTARLPRVIFVR
jgi:methionine synthase II (cobalamin-independent)